MPKLLPVRPRLRALVWFRVRRVGEMGESPRGWPHPAKCREAAYVVCGALPTTEDHARRRGGQEDTDHGGPSKETTEWGVLCELSRVGK